MASYPAFALGASSFTASRVHGSLSSPSICAQSATSSRPATIHMQQKKGLFSNPFAPKDKNQSEPASAFVEPQPGDPGYKPLPPVPKGFGMQKSEPRAGQKTDEKTKSAGGVKLPVAAGDAVDTVKRGLDLLKEDVFKTAPEQVGVGRQDAAVTMRPVVGEPGYKPTALQTVMVSELGISPFPDDANAVGKVGGVEAVKKAAAEVVRKGKTAKEIKREVLQISTKKEPVEFDIPDYLKSLPEDTPTKGMTWKNYVGR